MRVGRLAAVAAGVFGLVAVSAAAGLGPATPKPAISDGIAVRPGVIHIAREARSSDLTTAECEKDYDIACYGPAQVRRAYGLPALYAKGVTGRGATIVIVDAYGSPTIRNDLTAFDRAYRLPAPPKFQVIHPAGRIPAFDPANSDMVGWAGETTLDVEWAHTVAPGANLLLVETPVSETEGVHGFPQIVQAEQYVLNHHLGDVISQGLRATEDTFTRQVQVQAL